MCSNKETFPCLCKKTKVLADLVILSFFLISILTFGLSLRQLEDEYEIILINFFKEQVFCLGLSSELILSILAETTVCFNWQPGETVEQSPRTSPISQHCSDLDSPVHSAQQESASKLGSALSPGICLLTRSS